MICVHSDPRHSSLLGSGGGRGVYLSTLLCVYFDHQKGSCSRDQKQRWSNRPLIRDARCLAALLLVLLWFQMCSEGWWPAVSANLTKFCSWESTMQRHANNRTGAVGPVFSGLCSFLLQVPGWEHRGERGRRERRTGESCGLRGQGFLHVQRRPRRPRGFRHDGRAQRLRLRRSVRPAHNTCTARWVTGLALPSFVKVCSVTERSGDLTIFFIFCAFSGVLMINYTSHYPFDILFWQHLQGSANISFIASANYISIKDCVILSVSVLYMYTYDRTN